MLEKGWNSESVVSAVARQELSNIIRDTLRSPEMNAKIREKVDSYFAEQFTDEILRKMIGRLWDDLIERR
jgi:hypothetical protein